MEWLFGGSPASIEDQEKIWLRIRNTIKNELNPLTQLEKKFRLSMTDKELKLSLKNNYSINQKENSIFENIK